MKLYKVLRDDGRCFHGGMGSWPLPNGKRPGAWMPKIKGEIVACSNGYHVCRIDHLLDWLGPAIFTVEIEGEPVDGGNKLVVARARLVTRTPWNDRIAHLFAADCAERVLPLFERERPADKRPRECIAVTRRFANGEATQDELDAAWAAAWDVARDAAWAAAWDVARDAAWAAAWDAARDAEQKWQIKRLQQYLDGKLP